VADHLTIDTLREMFARMRATPELDVDGDLLWGYFFFNPASEPLATLASELGGMAYRVVRLDLTDDKSSHVLHVERIENHTPQSLFDRNAELERLAAIHGVASYDGMDVGPPP
jgi:hypothetical protein